MIRLAIPACIASLTAAPLPAFAYSCALSPARDAVIVKTDNAYFTLDVLYSEHDFLRAADSG